MKNDKSTLNKEQRAEYDLIIKVMNDIVHEMNKLALKKALKGNAHLKAVTLGLLFAPASFIMSFAATLAEMDVEMKDEFPEFIQVYKNYLATFVEVEDDFHNLPFLEFKKKFDSAYLKFGVVEEK